MKQQLSRKEFIRLLVVGVSAAAVGGLGCLDGTMKAPGYYRPRPEDDPFEEGNDEPPTAAPKETKSASLGDGGGTSSAQPAPADPVSSPAPAPAARDAGAADAAPANACLQNLALDQANGITSGHAHAFTIPAADFASDVDRTYTMNGAHGHDVTITPAQFAMLRAGETVMLTSTSTNNHTHAVAVKCA